MGNTNFLRSLSIHSKLLRNNLLNCWGSNPKVRNSPSKLLGFSASVALVGFGVQQALVNNYSVDCGEIKSRRRRSSDEFWELERDDRLLRLEDKLKLFHHHPPFCKEILTTSENLPVTSKKKFKCRKGVSSFSFFDSIKSFSLLTPVSCRGAEGEDVICNCSACNPPPTLSIFKSTFKPKVVSSRECDCEECRKKCTTPPETQNKVVEENPPPPPPVVTPPPVTPSTPSNNDNTTSPPSGGKSSPPVSNKPCRQSGSKTCSQVSEIDIDALAKQLGGLSQIDFAVGDSDLSHCFLMKQASQLTVDSVTRLLTEAASAYDDYHAEYQRVIDMMMDTLEDSRYACGAELEVIECKIVLIRAKVDEMKRRIAEVDMLIGSLEKLGNASAEVAFMANAEYASIAMSERLQSLLLEVKRLQEVSREKERDMLELQSLIIVETGKSLK